MSAKTNDNEVLTDVGRAGFGDNAFKGRAVLAEIAGRQPTWSLCSMAVGGPALGDQQTALLEYLTGATLVPDPRIWLFKVCRLVASYGAPLTARGAAMLVLEGSFLGPNAVAATASSLLRARGELGEAPSASSVAEYVCGWFDRRRSLLGFGVVGREHDERFVNIARWYADNRPADGEYWTLSQLLVSAVDEVAGLRPNVALALAAILLDMGYTTEQIKLLSMHLMDVILTAMSYEGAEQASACLRCVPPESVVYRGPKPRKSPRAQRRAK